MCIRLICVFTFCFLSSGCRQQKKAGLDRALYQSAAAEALLRYVIAESPARTQAKIAVIRFGTEDMQADPAFEERMSTPGLPIIPHDRLRAGQAHGQIRIFDSQSGEPPLELQISSLTEPKDGRQTAEAAWAYIDKSERKRYEIAAKSGGTFDIKVLEVMPIPHRNEDFKTPSK